MVTLEKDTPVPTQEHLRVAIGGVYEDTDLVGVYNVDDEQKIALCAFQAHFIAFGYNVGEGE